MYCSGCSMGVMLCCMQCTQSQCMEWRERWRDDSTKTETREHKAPQGQSLQTHLATPDAVLSMFSLYGCLKKNHTDFASACVC